jgi:hypothetical protein
VVSANLNEFKYGKDNKKLSYVFTCFKPVFLNMLYMNLIHYMIKITMLCLVASYHLAGPAVDVFIVCFSVPLMVNVCTSGRFIVLILLQFYRDENRRDKYQERVADGVL